MSANKEQYAMLFEMIVDEISVAVARCACVACNSCTCACSCRNIQNLDELDWD